MTKRVRSKKAGGGNYFASPKNIQFISSGCKTLDLALGGGWAEGRVVNIIGDKSTGKTLLAIEACANFAIKYPHGKMFYREAESAFDKHYAAALGFPVDRVDFKQPRTVEDVFEDIETVLEKLKGQAGLYIIDSLDALSDREEMARKIDAGSYGAGKAKKMSELFRRLVDRLEASGLTLMIISQIRDKIGVMFGPKTARTGGHAMDFYASQVVYLYHIGRIKRTIKGQERAIGVEVRAKIDKNKIGLPFREAEFNIIFGFGVDDAGACVSYLEKAKALEMIRLKPDKAKAYRSELEKMSPAEYRHELYDLHEAVEEHWWETERSFLPSRRKYAET